MRIGLAAIEFRNNQLDFNLSQIYRAIDQAKQQACDLVCLGESFLQGFDAFDWTYQHDRAIALEQTDELIRELGVYAKNQAVDVAFGYLEMEKDKLYSSYLLIEQGEIKQNYRRISRGWKEYTITDHHYVEGDEVKAFDYRGYKLVMSLCGDLWDEPERFQLGQDITLWPVYVDFSLTDWEQYSPEYCEQASLLPGHVLLVNSVCQPTGMGGAFHYHDGVIQASIAPGQEGFLVVELE